MMAGNAPTCGSRPRLDDRTEEVIRRVVESAPPLSADQIARLRQLLPRVPLPEQPTGEHDAA